MKSSVQASLLMLFLAGAFSGCSTFKSHPLIFGSHQAIGIKVGYHETTGPNLNVGYDGTDVSIVPTIFSGDADQIVLAVRGCYYTGIQTNHEIECHDDIYNGNKIAHDDHNKKTSGSKIEGQPASWSSEDDPIRYQEVTAIPLEEGDALPLDQALPVPAGIGTAKKAANPNGAAQSIKDALSVFSSFESGADAKTKEVGFSLGKLYATGAAAQHLTEGLGIKLQREGDTAKIKAVTQCITKLKEILGNDLKREDIKMCVFSSSLAKKQNAK